jgi:hypothetical protein
MCMYENEWHKSVPWAVLFEVEIVEGKDCPTDYLEIILCGTVAYAFSIDYYDYKGCLLLCDKNQGFQSDYMQDEAIKLNLDNNQIENIIQWNGRLKDISFFSMK